jgi:hypothetical protein
MPVHYRFLPAIILITAVGPAAADPVSVVSSSRFVQATASGPCCGMTNIAQTDADSLALTAVPPLEPNPSAGASATETSRILEAERFFYGRGSVSGQVMGPGGEATAQSYYRLTLDLSQPQNFVFIGVFNSMRANDGDSTSWIASLTGHDAPDAPIFALRSSDSFDRFLPGTLQPGRYDFLVSEAAISTLPGGLAVGSDDFRLEFSDVPPVPTPEPASLLLVGSGVAALVARRHRTRTPSGPPR